LALHRRAGKAENALASDWIALSRDALRDQGGYRDSAIHVVHGVPRAFSQEDAEGAEG